MRSIYCNKIIYLFLENVEVVDDNTNEEVQSEERAEYDEDDEVEIVIESIFTTWLLVNLKHEK